MCVCMNVKSVVYVYVHAYYLLGHVGGVAGVAGAQQLALRAEGQEVLGAGVADQAAAAAALCMVDGGMREGDKSQWRYSRPSHFKD